jgi:carboxylesterase
MRIDAEPASGGPRDRDSRVGGGTEPFHFAGGDGGCLLVHGFTATPWEMRYLGEHLHRAGYTVHGVRLAGHATSPADLERSTWREWYASARQGLLVLQAGAPRSVVVGQSMGALLAVRLAVEHPEAVAGVALLAPALQLSTRWLQWMRPAFPVVLPFLTPRFRFVSKGDSDVADPQVRAQTPSYHRIPLRAVHQLLQLQREARRLLPRIAQPILVLHSQQDHTCPVANVDLVRRRVPGPVETRLLARSYHVVSVDVERDDVAAAVADFTARTLQARPATGRAPALASAGGAG